MVFFNQLIAKREKVCLVSPNFFMIFPSPQKGRSFFDILQVRYYFVLFTFLLTISIDGYKEDTVFPSHFSIYTPLKFHNTSVTPFQFIALFVKYIQLFITLFYYIDLSLIFQILGLWYSHYSFFIKSSKVGCIKQRNKY